METKESIILYGADWCADCHRVRDILDAHQIAYTYEDTDKPDIHTRMLAAVNGKDEIPVLIRGVDVRQNPSNVELMEWLGLAHEVDKVKHDVVVVGGGPAGLTAAMYMTREDIDALIFERGVVGGLIATTDMVDNYPGFPDGVAGLTLADNMRKQAERFGAQIELGEVLKVIDEGEYRHLETTSGDIYARAVLVATGSGYKKIGAPGEEEYYARGVHYCATCDGAFYKGKRLVVVGGGNSGVQEALFLTRFATHIDLLVRSTLKASEVMQHKLAEAVQDGKITVHLQTTTDEIVGKDGGVVKVIGTDKSTGKKVEFPTDGVFVFVGLQPNSEFLKTSGIDLDAVGFVLTNDHLQTSMKGVFAAGDIRSGATMQVATAAGEGATAALTIREFLEGKLDSADDIHAPKQS
jgi:thioredoxin reductase (NADPH)